VLEPEHATVGAAPMPTAPKKSSIATNYFLRCHVCGALLQLSLLVDLNTNMRKHFAYSRKKNENDECVERSLLSKTHRLLTFCW